MKQVMFKIISEYRTIFFALLITLVINLVAIISFQKISLVSHRISLSLQNEFPTSIVAKQLAIELGSAENATRAYYLTDNKESLKNYHQASSNIHRLLLNLNTYQFIEDSTIIDSISYYSKEFVKALRSQSYLKNPKHIVHELDELSEEIDVIYEDENSKITKDKTVNPKDTNNKKKSFLRRLFSKKKELNEHTKSNDLNNIESQLKALKMQNQLKEALNTTKSNQAQMIDENRQSEFDLYRTIFICKERINILIEKLKIKEDNRKANNAIIANNELTKLRMFTLFSAALLTLFLLTLIYLAYAYIKKKNHYETLLLKAKAEAENLAITKERFLNSMSHEIKTPLNAIKGFSEILVNSDLNIEQKKQLNIIKNSTTYLNSLINNILSNARLNAGKARLDATKINIKDEITEIYQLLLPQALSKEIKFELEFNQCEKEFIIIDIDKLKQVLFNLLGNAIKFTNYGSVKIEVQQIIEKHTLLNFIIKDTGIGIDKDTLPKLFEEFEQGSEETQTKYGGTGLGLVITKKTIILLGGEINLKSELGYGTVVNFNIPYELPIKSDEIGTIKKDLNLEYLRNKSLLVVDDEEFNRLLLRNMLTNYGPIITEARNGSEALIEQSKTNFDLIIMDVKMPEMNGIEATIEIRKKNKHVIILGATAVINDEKITSCKQAGMNDVIFKPFSMEELSIKFDKLFNIQNINEMRVYDEIKIKDSSINVNAIDYDTGGDEKFKKELITVFHKSLNEVIAQINKLVEENNYDLISEKAHKIIPSCKHFETHRLLESLNYIEQACNLSNVDILKFKKHITNINEELVNINKLLSPFLT